MNYEALEAAYWIAQKERIESLRARISEKAYLGAGRTVPDDDSLAIGDGRRLSMAVMFIDICGFSSRGMETQNEQEVMLKALNLFFTEMIRISEEYGGNVEKNTGDGLMIYFNDNEGTPPEVGPKRAVACALTMFAATKELINPILVASSIEPIDFRVSIDYGMVTIARIGAPRRFNANTAIGTTANFASKMMRRAGKNEIVIGASALEKLPPHWRRMYATPMVESTGWSYRKDGSPYLLYKYTGRWTSLK